MPHLLIPYGEGADGLPLSPSQAAHSAQIYHGMIVDLQDNLDLVLDKYLHQSQTQWARLKASILALPHDQKQLVASDMLAEKVSFRDVCQTFFEQRLGVPDRSDRPKRKPPGSAEKIALWRNAKLLEPFVKREKVGVKFTTNTSFASGPRRRKVEGQPKNVQEEGDPFALLKRKRAILAILEPFVKADYFGFAITPLATYKNGPNGQTLGVGAYHIDHHLPYSLGGEDKLENFVLANGRQNMSKSASINCLCQRTDMKHGMTPGSLLTSLQSPTGLAAVNPLQLLLGYKLDKEVYKVVWARSKMTLLFGKHTGAHDSWPEWNQLLHLYDLFEQRQAYIRSKYESWPQQETKMLPTVAQSSTATEPAPSSLEAGRPTSHVDPSLLFSRDSPTRFESSSSVSTDKRFLEAPVNMLQLEMGRTYHVEIMREVKPGHYVMALAEDSKRTYTVTYTLNKAWEAYQAQPRSEKFTFKYVQQRTALQSGRVYADTTSPYGLAK
jgi:hypothetical protein